MTEMSNVPRSVGKLYLRASYHVYKIGCFLVRGISLPAAQLFVIVIENILRGGGVGNLTRYREKSMTFLSGFPSHELPPATGTPALLFYSVVVFRYGVH